MINTSDLIYLVKSYLSESAIQNWINDKAQEGYKLIFFNSEYDTINKKIIFTAVLELKHE